MTPQERNRTYYLANREKIKSRSREWHAANREYANACRKARAAAKLEETKEKRAAYYHANKERISNQRREHYERNKNRALERVKKWRENLSGEKLAAHKKRKRERERERKLEHPEKYSIDRARQTLRLTTGLAAKDLDPALIEAKAAQIAIYNAIKNQGVCRSGHALTDDNVRTRGDGRRECRACAIERCRHHRSSAKAAALHLVGSTGVNG